VRARAIRGALAKIALGTVFVVGALAHALSPERHDRSSVLWMTTLLLLSTVNVAWGLRTLSRARRRNGSAWILATVAWGLLALVLLGLLLRR
jgi:heme/copper-type cytochrome/quinol oxidase subunit 3